MKRTTGPQAPRVIEITVQFPRGVDEERARAVADCILHELSLCYDPRYFNRFESLFPPGTMRDPEGIELDTSKPWFGMARCPLGFPPPTSKKLHIGYGEPVTWSTEKAYWNRALQVLIDEKELRIRRRAGKVIVVRPTSGESVNWSIPNTIKQWARVFKVSSTTMRRDIKEGRVRAKKITRQRYRIALADLPPEGRK